MIARRIEPVLRRRLREYPAAALVGPRQCGKTTLAKKLGGVYFDLEQEAERLRLDLEWPELVARRRLIILDEAQTWPEVFARIRGAVDLDRKREGRFLILGSVSPALMKQVGESLTGRLAIVELSPFTFLELSKASITRLWLTGGYPDGGVIHPRRFPQWQRDYLTLLTQRDLPNWGLPAKPAVIDRLLHMTAANHGQTWNASQIGQSLGLSYHTINDYLDYLVGAFLLRRLQPFHANLGKRLVKTPKIYWRDSGLLHSLLNARDAKTLTIQPWVGASWEGFVIEQILATLVQLDAHFEPYFFRTSDGHEIDLLLDFGSKRWAVEIKLTTNPSEHDMARLDRAADLTGADRRFLVSQTKTVAEGEGRASCHLPWLLRKLKQELQK